MSELRPKHLKALRRAVREAECWRGAIIGNPDTTELDKFDKFIATAKEAVSILSTHQRAIK